MSALRPAVDALYAALGLAPPVEAPGAAFEVDLDGVPVVLAVAPDGRTGTVHATLGTLAPSSHEAGAQLARLMRIGLGLSAGNPAALDLPGAAALAAGRDGADRRVRAVAVFPLDQPAAAVDAVRAAMEWQGYAETILGPPAHGTADDAPTARDAPPPDDRFVIFQP